MGNLGSPAKGITWGYIPKPPINIYFISRFMEWHGTSWKLWSKTTQIIGHKRSTPKWISSPEGSLKFNVDGAVARSENKGAIGVICRDNSGNYVAPMQWSLTFLFTLLP
jgi:hypothetical protein